MKQYKCFCCNRTFNEQLSKIDGKYWCPDCIEKRIHIANLIDGIDGNKNANRFKELDNNDYISG